MMDDGAPILDQAEVPRPGLDAEWQRLDALLHLVETLRRADEPAKDIEEKFAKLQEDVTQRRAAGAWAGLSQLVDQDQLSELKSFDLDLMALALLPEAMPMMAPRLDALQPYVATPAPSLPLIQEILMLDSADDMALLADRFAPTAPLIRHGLVVLERQGEYLCLRPGPGLISALLGRSATLGPPPGADQVPLGPGWEGLVLPENTLQRLRELAAWIAHKDKIFGDWKGRRISGPMALFAGASGVGKSFAVKVLTRELENLTRNPWVLYRLDLGRIVSKYVGETEKNLNALLDSLHGTQAVLQIDEADGLMGRRGEVSEARDRYANLEVSHMLSRFERHDGPVVLTSNLRRNIDTAFVRRFQVVVDFPGPDAALRGKLWDRLLPQNIPREETLDSTELGAAIPLSGGAIHNAAIYAAVLAADQNSNLGPQHVAQAAWRELNKEARKVRSSELGDLARHLKEEQA